MRYADRDHKKTKRAVLWRSVSIFFSLYFVWWFRSLLLFLFFFQPSFTRVVSNVVLLLFFFLGDSTRTDSIMSEDVR